MTIEAKMQQQYIDTIYKIVSDKTLKIGCIVYIFWSKRRQVIDEYPDENNLRVSRYKTTTFEKDEYTVYGNPVMIWDFEAYFEDFLDSIDLDKRERDKDGKPIEERTDEIYDMLSDIRQHRGNKREPIEKQEELSVYKIYKILMHHIIHHKNK